MPGTGALLSSANSFLGTVPGIPFLLTDTPSQPGQQASCVPNCGQLAPWLVYGMWGIAAILVISVIVLIIIAIVRSL